MATVLDVAAYILQKRGPMSAMKLQKLVYYSQAWSLVWDDVPLFDNRIEAWANGPVAPDLYRAHRGRFTLNSGDIPGDPQALESYERETIDAVLDFYGDKSAPWLSQLTHNEDPWKDARTDAGLKDLERGNAVITHASMAEFYEAVYANPTE